MRSDSEIRQNVESEFRWDPDIKSDDIAVAVDGGVVMLTGFVRSYGQRREAESDAKRAAGVMAVANDIEVRLPIIHWRPDPEIARDAASALKALLQHSWDGIQVVVKNGWVTLEGQVEWNYERERAEDAVRRIRGVKGITNSIQVRSRARSLEVKHRIEEALTETRR
jgi:osmotically-inducible protein OsmY